MTTKQGRSPSSRAAAASAVEPVCAVSSTASIPNAVHVIVRRTGSYEYTETLICAVPTEAEAMRLCIRAEDEWKAAVEAAPDTLDYPADGAADEEWTKWERRRKRAWKRFKAMLSVDPDAAPEGAWNSPDEPEYYSSVVPLLAAGIEARSDATPKSGAAGTAKARSEGDAQ